jgi:hypothetical protein
MKEAVRRATFSKLTFCAVFALGYAISPVRAQGLPGIDRPPNEVAEHLGAIFNCRMTILPDAAGCSGNTPRNGELDLLRTRMQNTFDTARAPFNLPRRRGQPTDQDRADTALLIEALIYLAPSWPNARQWLESAIAAADRDDACSYIKIRGVVISMRPVRPVDSPTRYIDLYLTRNFDIYSLCEY